MDPRAGNLKNAGPEVADLGWAWEDLNLGPLPYQAKQDSKGPVEMTALNWPDCTPTSVNIRRRLPGLSRSSSRTGGAVRFRASAHDERGVLSDSVHDLHQVGPSGQCGDGNRHGVGSHDVRCDEHNAALDAFPESRPWPVLV